MIENTISISQLNDFIFCPYSIYLHNVYQQSNEFNYHQISQLAGKAVHKTIDKKQYSTSTNFIQGLSVYSDKYGLIGKIDLYDKKRQKLTERKRQIKQIYDGYRLQIYAQYFCMIEMGYLVSSLCFYSYLDNKSYDLTLPNQEQISWFEQIIRQFRSFNPEQNITINPKKCINCIYNPLCEKAKC